MDAISKFTLNEDLSLDSEVMNSHQKHPRGNNLIKEYMQLLISINLKTLKALFICLRFYKYEGVCIGIESNSES